ncbi:hypothetical protein KHA94_24300 [Bacillus sp. FJAT-49705]|uniref:Uncharacterized protein n=1 Tax=Cytobacillus citreus TaxID=2833586 RepID=A0ABS5P130_9BACI|nr:hypothetical protein [Cytobacillus citreus]MBS4193218.1 hypothetical protein [Cytobacillus citreus]
MSTQEKIKAGYWSIATQKHLKQFQVDSAGLSNFGSINIAGKAGRFLGVIRGNGVIENMEKLVQMANTVGINSKHELEMIILPYLAKASDKQIELIKDTTGSITGVAEYVFTNSKVLEISGQLFDNLSPNAFELVTVETMDETKKIPYLQSELTQLLVEQGYSEKDISLAYALQKQFKLIQMFEKSKSQERIISNEYVWGANSQKIALAISGLEIEGRQTLKEIIEIIQRTQGYPLEKLPVQSNEFLNLAKKIGMINPTTIVSRRGFQKDFGFSSDLIGANLNNDDILDDVKLLLASIRFGENYTPHSTINDPERFLNKLINSGDIGPHDANATDYTLLEKKGIVKVVTKTKFNYYTGRARTGSCLELIRKDVAEEALKIIKSPDYNFQTDSDITDFSSMIETGSFLTPEESRIRLGESPEHVQEVEEHAVRLLRGELL